MVQGHYISGGGPGLLQTFVRSVFVILAAIGGFFIFAASAAFALIVTGGLIIFGFIIFSALWLRAKIMGKPLNPYVKMRTEFPFSTTQKQPQPGQKQDGPVLDAHKTPEGWSVDDN